MTTIGQPALEEAINAWADYLLRYAEQVPPGRLAIVGLIRRGDVLARRLADKLEAAGQHALFGALDISLYRDDLSMMDRKPALHSSYLPFSTDDLHLVLVDDVINTGRSIRAALNAVFEYGRPAGVKLHCLVDRGGREVPIHPDYAAFRLNLPADAEVSVHLDQPDGSESITY